MQLFRMIKYRQYCPQFLIKSKINNTYMFKVVFFDTYDNRLSINIRWRHQWELAPQYQGDFNPIPQYVITGLPDETI